MNEAITIVLSSLGGFLSGFSGWFFYRRKNNAEADAAEITNTKELIELYRTATNEAVESLKELNSELQKIRELCQNPKICLSSKS